MPGVDTERQGGASELQLKLKLIDDYMRVHIPQFMGDFDRVVCHIYPKCRRHMVVAICKEKGPDALLIDGEKIFKSSVLKQGRKDISEETASLTVKKGKGKRVPLWPQGTFSLREFSGEMGRYISCMKSTFLALTDARAFCQKEADKVRGKTLSAKARSNFARYKEIMLYLSEKQKEILRIQARLKTLVDIDTLEDLQEQVIVESGSDGLNYQIPTHLTCRDVDQIPSDILLDAGENSVIDVDFESTCVKLQTEARQPPVSLIVRNCRGKLTIADIHADLCVEVHDSPHLTLVVGGSRVRHISTRGGIKVIRFASSQAEQLSISGAAGLVAASKSTIKQIQLDDVDIERVAIMRDSSTCIRANSGGINKLDFGQGSQVSLHLTSMTIKKGLEFHGSLCLVAHNTSVGNIEAHDPEFIACCLSDSTVNVPTLSSGALQEVTRHVPLEDAPQGGSADTRIVLYSKQLEESLITRHIPCAGLREIQDANWRRLATMVSDSESIPDFMSGISSQRSGPAIAFLTQHLPLLMLRRGISPPETALPEIIRCHVDLVRLSEEIATADDIIHHQLGTFFLWQAEHRPQERRQILDAMSEADRTYATDYVDGLLKRGRKTTKQVARYSQDSVNFALFAQMQRFLSSYKPGLWRGCLKEKIKREILNLATTVLLDASSQDQSWEETIEQLGDGIRAIEDDYSRAVGRSRLLRSFLLLANNALRSRRRISILSTRISDALYHVLDDDRQEKPESFKAIMRVHLAESITGFTANATTKTLKKIYKKAHTLSSDSGFYRKLLANQAIGPNAARLWREETVYNSIRQALGAVITIASAYRPLFSLFGNGRKKLLAMRALCRVAEEGMAQRSERNAIAYYDRIQQYLATLQQGTVIPRRLRHQDNRVNVWIHQAARVNDFKPRTSIRGFGSTLERIGFFAQQRRKQAFSFPSKENIAHFPHEGTDREKNRYTDGFERGFICNGRPDPDIGRVLARRQVNLLACASEARAADPEQHSVFEYPDL